MSCLAINFDKSFMEFQALKLTAISQGKANAMVMEKGLDDDDE